MALKVGYTAPDFTLLNIKAEKISLSDFKEEKNVVILFFPFANSSTCEKELCSTRDGLSQYEELDAQILAISVDSHFALKMWAEKHKFNFPLLSDFNKEVSKSYDTLYDIFSPGKYDYAGVSKRSAFVVDKKGVIQYAEVLESSGSEPNYDAIKVALQKLS
ncbi:MAG: peroxiredoxin [Ignavibacteria bacterium GWB2_35_6b]|nr:MAG: peroxiredoxin [Ignavibacteria bacterium GWB2_35_6b]